LNCSLIPNTCQSYFDPTSQNHRVEVLVHQRAARQKGVRLGRRPTSSKVEERIGELRAAGHAILKIARELGIGASVVQRVEQEAQIAQGSGSITRERSFRSGGSQRTFRICTG
jgi:DNA invertase Pin-like site-specific DNA recombinase